MPAVSITALAADFSDISKEDVVYQTSVAPVRAAEPEEDEEDRADAEEEGTPAPIDKHNFACVKE